MAIRNTPRYHAVEFHTTSYSKRKWKGMLVNDLTLWRLVASQFCRWMATQLVVSLPGGVISPTLETLNKELINSRCANYAQMIWSIIDVCMKSSCPKWSNALKVKLDFAVRNTRERKMRLQRWDRKVLEKSFMAWWDQDGLRSKWWKETYLLMMQNTHARLVWFHGSGLHDCLWNKFTRLYWWCNSWLYGSRMNSEVHQTIEVEDLRLSKSVTGPKPNRACISPCDVEKDGRKPQKQTRAERSCNKGLKTVYCRQLL